MSQLISKALPPPAPADFRDASLFLPGDKGTYFHLPQTLHSDHQAILRCQNIIQTRIVTLHYLRMWNNASFHSYHTCSFFQHLHSIPLLCIPVDVLCCRKGHSSYQKSKTHLMVCQRAWSLPNSLEISGDICHASMQQIDMFTEILVKSHKKANSIATQFLLSQESIQVTAVGPPSLVRSGTDLC